MIPRIIIGENKLKSFARCLVNKIISEEQERNRATIVINIKRSDLSGIKKA